MVAPHVKRKRKAIAAAAAAKKAAEEAAKKAPPEAKEVRPVKEIEEVEPKRVTEETAPKQATTKKTLNPVAKKIEAENKTKKYKYPDGSYYYLHIGKTGGLAIRELFGRNKLKFFAGHIEANLCPSLKNTKIIFFYRDPIERFISAFYYYKFKLKLPYISEYNTPNDLAEVWNPTRKEFHIIKNNSKCTHLWKTLFDYLGPIDNLEELKDSLFFVGNYDNNFPEEVRKMSEKMGLRNTKVIQKNRFNQFAGKNRVKDKNLSSLAKENLEQYFSEDYKIIRWIEENKI